MCQISVFQIIGRSHLGERSTTKNFRCISLLSVVSKFFEKLVNNKLVDHLEKCGLFSYFR